MSGPFIAEVQYGDFQGTLAADGGDGPPLDKLKKLCNVPPGFFVIGFSLCRLDPIGQYDPSSDKLGLIPMSAIAVKESDVAATMQEIVDYAAENSNLPAYSFDGYLRPEDFGWLFKRMDIKVLSKYINPDAVRIVGDREDAAAG